MVHDQEGGGASLDAAWLGNAPYGWEVGGPRHLKIEEAAVEERRRPEATPPRWGLRGSVDTHPQERGGKEAVAASAAVRRPTLCGTRRWWAQSEPGPPEPQPAPVISPSSGASLVAPHPLTKSLRTSGWQPTR